MPESGEVILIAVGKAAWRMAQSAHGILGSRVARGCVITKDGHSMGPIGNLEIYESAHPVPEKRNLTATRRALALVDGLKKEDSVLFLVSGGGSALFELPLDGISLADTTDMTSQLLACGADIVEINTLRKRVSAVKGGRFALACMPARVRCVLLSDVPDGLADSVASGPACPDTGTREKAEAVVRRYGLMLSPSVMDALKIETPKTLSNVEMQITGSVSLLCEAALGFLAEEGFDATLLTTSLDCEAAAAGAFFSAVAREAVRRRPSRARPVAYVAGGETVVKLKGRGKGGRCQEAALAAALGIRGLSGVAFAAAGSDGTDGPTDAAGGIVDGESERRMAEKGIDARERLDENDAYRALTASGDLLITGPTGTNVNDLMLLLVE